MRVLLLGTNPSVKAGNNEAFTADTVSGRILRGWLEGIDATFIFDNVVACKTANNRPLSKTELAEAQETLLERIKENAPDRIVALGKSASNILDKLGLSYLEMPHPSGLNRKLNDKQWLSQKINDLQEYATEQ